MAVTRNPATREQAVLLLSLMAENRRLLGYAPLEETIDAITEGHSHEGARRDIAGFLRANAQLRRKYKQGVRWENGVIVSRAEVEPLKRGDRVRFKATHDTLEGEFVCYSVDNPGFAHVQTRVMCIEIEASRLVAV